MVRNIYTTRRIVISAPSPTPTPTPTPGPSGGLIAWFEADAAGTLTFNNELGIPIAMEWRDLTSGKKATNNILTQGATTYTTPSGRQCLSFDGVDDWFDLGSDIWGLLASVKGISVSLVYNIVRPSGSEISRAFYVSNGLDPYGVRFSLGVTPSGNPARWYSEGERVDTDSYNYIAGGIADYEGWRVDTMVRDYQNATVKLYSNAILKYSGSPFGTTGISDSTTPAIARIGAGGLGQTPALMRLYAIKIYNDVISETQIAADNTYGFERINA